MVATYKTIFSKDTRVKILKKEVTKKKKTQTNFTLETSGLTRLSFFYTRGIHYTSKDHWYSFLIFLYHFNQKEGKNPPSPTPHPPSSLLQSEITGSTSRYHVRTGDVTL